MTAFFKTGLTQQQFLDTYWQKRPLLIRGAFSGVENLLSANDLAGLACEPDIESRLVIGQGAQWDVRQGPFVENDFVTLSEQYWTLLVQDVDKHLPELQTLLTPFDFIPNWRRDDVMVSYAADGGSVGPHTDSYDVFLLQAQGTRRWQITENPLKKPALLADCELQILAEFTPEQEWLLSPGDMLYLPPHFGHHGVAVGECMTFSIGFRAPKYNDMLEAVLLSMSEHGFGQQHYHDEQGLVVAENHYEISPSAVTQFQQQLHEALDSAYPLLLEAMGKQLTETKVTLEHQAFDVIGEPITVADISAFFEQGQSLHRNPYYRFAWAMDKNDIAVFLAGECYRFDREHKNVVVSLVEQSILHASDWMRIQTVPELAKQVCEWLNQGSWYWAGNASD